MKKVCTLFFAIFFSWTIAFSQAVQETDKILSLNIGFPPTGMWPGEKMKMPVISANFDYLLKKAGPGIIGVGGLLGIVITEDYYSYYFPDEYYRYTKFYLGARATYHWFPGTSDKINTYAGFSLGAKIVSAKYTGSSVNPSLSSNGSGAFGGPFVGIRYLFNPNIGVNAELGYGVAVLTLGGSFKF
jgi:hypothetical protein